MRKLAAIAIVLAACQGNRGAQGTGTGTGSAGGSATHGSGSAGDPAVGPSATITAPTVRYLTPSMQAVKEPPVPLPRQESFTLLAPGTGARAVLRYALATEAGEYRSTLTLTTRQLDGATFTTPTTLPPIREGFGITPASTTSLLVRALDAEVVGATTPAADAYVAAVRGAMAARRATVGFDDRGQLGAIAFADDPTGTQGVAASDELAQRLLVAMVPLPAEPVGIGAQWRVVTILRQGPLYVKQTATYELAERTATTLTVHASIVRNGEQQLVADPALPPHTVAELIALVRDLHGDLVVDLRRPLAIGGALTLESRLHARITPQNQPAVEQLVEDSGPIAISAGP